MDDLEEFDDLHADEDVAFCQLVGKFDEELARHMEHTDDQTDIRFFLIEYMSKVVSAADALNIDEFSGWQIPTHDHNVFTEHQGFSVAVKSYVLGVRIRRSRTGKVYSVSLDQAAKAKIHHLVQRIRKLIEDSNLEDRKKNSLYSKLNAFDADVDRARTRFDNAMLMGIDLAHVGKEYAGLLKPVTDLVKQINELLGKAKSEEPEKQQLPVPEDRKQIEPPRKRIEHRSSSDMDDEIPF